MNTQRLWAICHAACADFGRAPASPGDKAFLISLMGAVDRAARTELAEAEAEAEAEALARVVELESVILRLVSRLSLLRHRADIPWGKPCIGQATEYDEVIGLGERLLRQSTHRTPEAARGQEERDANG